MALSNHPDTLFALVQEHSVENLDGSALSPEHTVNPNRLVARSSSGEELEITALIKTQAAVDAAIAEIQAGDGARCAPSTAMRSTW